MYSYGKIISETNQKEVIFGREQEMVKNHADGYSFRIDKWSRLKRFLILGSESNSYYVTAKEITRENAHSALDCIREDGKKTIDICVQVSQEGIAPKNDPAIFAMALCASMGDDQTRRYAFKSLNKVCRIGTHIFMFVEYVTMFRGWGRGLRSGIANWYNSMPIDKLIYQTIKYPRRKVGSQTWSHRDLLRKSHPTTNDVIRNAVYNYIAQKELEHYEELKVFSVVEQLEDYSVKKLYDKIIEYKLPREVIAEKCNKNLNEAKIWEALLYSGMPMTAMIRNLGKMTNVGLLKTGTDDTVQYIIKELTNQDRLQKSRIHPINLMSAFKIYHQGHGNKGKLVWHPITQICDALDEAFYMSFKYIEPTNLRYSINLDVSGSMWWDKCMGLDGFTDAEIAGVMALSTAKSETRYDINAFTRNYIKTQISPKMRIDMVMEEMNKLSQQMGATDCAVPMIYALKNKIKYDVFIIYTDNETWVGDIHPSEALKKYRDKMGTDAKLIVCATRSTNFSIADPKDKGMLDIGGFDSSAPTIISEFARGNI